MTDDDKPPTLFFSTTLQGSFRENTMRVLKNYKEKDPSEETLNSIKEDVKNLVLIFNSQHMFCPRCKNRRVLDMFYRGFDAKGPRGEELLKIGIQIDMCQHCTNEIPKEKKIVFN